VRYYIVSWDNLGVEFFKEITEHHPDNWAKDHLFDSIKQTKIVSKKLDFYLNHLKLRAQFNNQRHYEIYVFTSNTDVDPQQIKTWFERDPQGFADWVRNNHSYKVFDNRRTHKNVII